ncbi:ABC transporter ATP-binding protein [hydrothermal vent metagenome]|uniref:ABC transporter ATP-binding protein n=1 Tax=hydrothermal vent metagenome TaxID=652676 RepID=A0A1W1BYZ9_9ZZZZ
MQRVDKLWLNGVNQRFNNKDLFREDVYLDIEKNSATIIYGGSGSGKTSLLNILVAIVPPSKGEVYWGDKKITSLKEANALRAEYMSVLFSNFAFINELSVKENILLPATLCDVKNMEQKLNEIAKTILNFKDIDENIDLDMLMQKESVSMLSNGQKEIVALASMLLLQTKFFIADEMLRSFPEDTKVILYKRLLDYFKKERVGFFYITHWLGAMQITKESGFSYKIYKVKDQKLQKESSCEY